MNLKEHYKQRLDEKLDRSQVKGTPGQRLAARSRQDGVPESLVDVAVRQARKQGTSETRLAQQDIGKWERQRARGRPVGYDGLPAVPADREMALAGMRAGLGSGAIRVMINKGVATNIASNNLSLSPGISRRERGLEVERKTGYIAARQAASRARKVARGLAEHFKQRLLEGPGEMTRPEMTRSKLVPKTPRTPQEAKAAYIAKHGPGGHGYPLHGKDPAAYERNLGGFKTG